MPPRQEFNASEAVFALAQRAGQGQLRDRRAREGERLVALATQRQAQQQALRLEEQRLQLLARQQRAAQTFTPSRGGNPLTQSVDEANARFKTNSTNLGLSTVEQSALDIAQRNNDKATVNSILQSALNRSRTPQGSPGAGSTSGQGSEFSIDTEGNIRGSQGGSELSEEEIQRRGGFVSSTRQDTDLQSSAKQEFLQKSQNLSPEQKEAFQVLVNDPSIDLQQLAIRVSSAQSRTSQNTLTARQQVSFQRSALREEGRQLDDRIDGLESELRDLGINVTGRNPAQVLQQLEDNPTTAPIAQQLFRQLTAAQVERRELLNQEQSLISGQVNQQQNLGQPQQQQDDISGAGTTDLFRELIQSLGQ